MIRFCKEIEVCFCGHNRPLGEELWQGNGAGIKTCDTAIALTGHTNFKGNPPGSYGGVRYQRHEVCADVDPANDQVRNLPCSSGFRIKVVQVAANVVPRGQSLSQTLRLSIVGGSVRDEYRHRESPL